MDVWTSYHAAERNDTKEMHNINDGERIFYMKLVYFKHCLSDGAYGYVLIATYNFSSNRCSASYKNTKHFVPTRQQSRTKHPHTEWLYTLSTVNMQSLVSFQRTRTDQLQSSLFQLNNRIFNLVSGLRNGGSFFESVYSCWSTWIFDLIAIFRKVCSKYSSLNKIWLFYFFEFGLDNVSYQKWVSS